MEAAPEIAKQLKPAERVAVINKPTSPDQIQDETAQAISVKLTETNQASTPESVRVDQSFKLTPQLKAIGAEPSGGEISPKDMLRIVTEEFAGDSEGAHRVVIGKGSDALSLQAGRSGKISKFLQRLHLKKAA